MPLCCSVVWPVCLDLNQGINPWCSTKYKEHCVEVPFSDKHMSLFSFLFWPQAKMALEMRKLCEILKVQAVTISLPPLCAQASCGPRVSALTQPSQAGPHCGQCYGCAGWHRNSSSPPRCRGMRCGKQCQWAMDPYLSQICHAQFRKMQIFVKLTSKT